MSACLFFPLRLVALVDQHPLGLKMWTAAPGWKIVSDDLIKQALELLLDVRNHPMLVTCVSGVHETGVVVGCLRRLQGWALTPTLDEYHALAGAKARLPPAQTIEVFDLDLISVAPASAGTWPAWWAAQVAADEADRERAIAMAPDRDGDGRMPSSLFSSVHGPCALPPPLSAEQLRRYFPGSADASGPRPGADGASHLSPTSPVPAEPAVGLAWPDGFGSAEYLFRWSGVTLVSPGVAFSRKKSLLVDDEDDKD